MTNIPTYHRGDRNFGTGFDMMERIEELEAKLAEYKLVASTLDAQLEQALRDAPSWQPIETAPKNTYILVFMDGSFFEARFICEEGYEQCAHWDFPFADAHGCGCCSGSRDRPTHWMPLPEQPK